MPSSIPVSILNRSDDIEEWLQTAGPYLHQIPLVYRKGILRSFLSNDLKFAADGLSPSPSCPYDIYLTCVRKALKPTLSQADAEDPFLIDGDSLMSLLKIYTSA